MPANSSNSPIAHQPATAVSQIKPWIERFRTQYPMGGLVAALAAVHEGQYIVQATLSVGGINVTSGLAEAPTLEESEAIAQGIALDRFGLEKLAPADVAVNGHGANGHGTNGHGAANGSLNGSALPKMEAMPAKSSAEASVAPTPEALEPPEAVLPVEAVSPAEDIPPVEAVPPAEDIAPPEMPPSEPPAKKTAKGKKAKPKPKSKAPKPKTQKSKANSQSEPVPSPALAEAPAIESPDGVEPEGAADAEVSEAPTFVADWSDDLAQIQVELKRLGWDANQSSDYLQRTYGKPSLDYITDHGELMDFLSYLRALPTHFDPGQFDEAPAVETEADVHIPAGYEQPEPLASAVEPPLNDLSEPAMPEPATSELVTPESVMPEQMESELAAPADANQPPAEAIADTTATPDGAEVPVPDVSVPDVSVPEVSLDVSLPPSAPEDALAPAPEDNFSHDFGGLSRDDMMQQSAAECKRLKWTNRQGSNFLSSRYGKPTRKDLSDQELWDFLQYLSSIAPVEETLKEKLPF